MKYLVQAILIDNTGRNTIETVVDSFKTDDYQVGIEFCMKRHRSSNKYIYNALDIEARKVVFSTTCNKFFMW